MHEISEPGILAREFAVGMPKLQCKVLRSELTEG